MTFEDFGVIVIRNQCPCSQFGAQASEDKELAVISNQRDKSYFDSYYVFLMI